MEIKILLNSHMSDILLVKLILSIIYVCFVHAPCVYITIYVCKYINFSAGSQILTLPLTPISWEPVTNVF